jgi:hypothetical protein
MHKERRETIFIPKKTTACGGGPPASPLVGKPGFARIIFLE